MAKRTKVSVSSAAGDGGGPETASGPAPASASKLTRYQRLTPVRLHRRQMANAPYNPRTLDASGRKKLRAGMKKNGYVGGICHNVRTGHIVGGHARIAQLDALEGSDDYEIIVDQIDVSLEDEMQINLLLNNLEAGGTFDRDGLAQVLSHLAEAGVKDIEGATGFDRNTVEMLMDSDIANSIFGPQEVAEAPILDAMQEMRDAGKEEGEEKDGGKGRGGEGEKKQGAELPSPWDIAASGQSPEFAPPGGSAAADKLDPNSREALVARRSDYLQEVADTGANDAEFMVVLVGNSNRQITEFLTALNLPIDSRYVPLAAFAAAVGISLDGGSEANGEPGGAGEGDSEPSPPLAE